MRDSSIANPQEDNTTLRRSLRLWPGIVAVILQWVVRFALPALFPETLEMAVLGGVLGGLVVIVWWAFFSRAAVLERFGAVALMIAALLVTPFLLHESIATAGMGLLFLVYAVPVLCLAFVAWAVLTKNLPDGKRRVSMVATILVACGAWTLIRTGGITGDLDSEFAWRWSKTPEEKLLEQADGELSPLATAPAVAETEAAWPGFRGSNRDGVVHDVRITTDWSATPPVELWRRPIGPGWSSFAVGGDLLYTQEQRGEEEVVACYNLTTGEPIWRHVDSARFWESNAGAGPRGTPTLSAGYIYAFGATGILNVLNANDGNLVWSRNAASDIGEEIPMWGFASSPLVVKDVVIVAVAGTLVAYDRNSGEQRWSGPDGGASYSSPHLVTAHGVPQVLLQSGAGATSIAPATGTLLWRHEWPEDTRIVQPAVTPSGDLLISGSPGGTRRIAVSPTDNGWTTEVRWTSIRLKPYFNDFVIHKAHAFGFDGGILACIDIEAGSRQWKGGRYGHGQLVLLSEQELLLVLSEKGELALVKATSDGYEELAKIQAIEGKTWNHPAVIDNVLLVRNDREMAAFQLPG